MITIGNFPYCGLNEITPLGMVMIDHRVGNLMRGSLCVWSVIPRALCVDPYAYDYTYAFESLMRSEPYAYA